MFTFIRRIFRRNNGIKNIDKYKHIKVESRAVCYKSKNVRVINSSPSTVAYKTLIDIPPIVSPYGSLSPRPKPSSTKRVTTPMPHSRVTSSEYILSVLP